jgi:hypothetical protein
VWQRHGLSFFSVTYFKQQNRFISSPTRAVGATTCWNRPRIHPQGLLWFIQGHELRLYLPPGAARIQIPRSAHCASDIHVGIQKTLLLLQRYWWPTKFPDVSNFVSSCWSYIAHESVYVKGRVIDTQHSTLSAVAKPFTAWQIDHCGPFTVTTGPRYSLVCVCDFSHYVIAIPVGGVDARTTAIELTHLLGIFGFPTKVHLDHGSAITSDLFKQIMSLLRIDNSLSPIAFARANGWAERAIGV